MGLARVPEIAVAAEAVAWLAGLVMQAGRVQTQVAQGLAVQALVALILLGVLACLIAGRLAAAIQLLAAPLRPDVVLERARSQAAPQALRGCRTRRRPLVLARQLWAPQVLLPPVMATPSAVQQVSQEMTLLPHWLSRLWAPLQGRCQGCVRREC